MPFPPPKPPSTVATSRPDDATAARIRASLRTLLAREPQALHSIAARAARPGDGSYPVEGRGELPTEIVHALLVAAEGQVGPDDVEQHWRFLGATAYRTGYPEDGLVRIGHAVLRAVRDASGDGWSSALSSGWMAYHAWMTEHFADGVAVARAGDPAAAAPDLARPAVDPDAVVRLPDVAPPGRDDPGTLDLVEAIRSGSRRRRR